MRRYWQGNNLKLDELSAMNALVDEAKSIVMKNIHQCLQPGSLPSQQRFSKVQVMPQLCDSFYRPSFFSNRQIADMTDITIGDLSITLSSPSLRSRRATVNMRDVCAATQ
jgi:hypothetical protein